MGDIDHEEEEPSEQLFPETFSRYGKLLSRMISRIARPHDVEDIVQETYMRVFRASQTHPIRDPQAFMIKTARNIVFEKLARADALNHVAASIDTEGKAVDSESFEESRDEQTPDTVLESEQEFAVLCRAIRELPRQCRRIFLLKKVYGLSQREIASRVGVTESTIEKHLNKAMVDCILYMEKSGYVNRRQRPLQATRPRKQR